MTASYALTSRAREGVRRIVFYVRQDFGEAVAERVLSELEQAFEFLAEHPDVGHFREDITRDVRVRFWPVGPTLIAYRSGPDALEVLFVERGEIDWARLLTEGSE